MIFKAGVFFYLKKYTLLHNDELAYKREFCFLV